MKDKLIRLSRRYSSGLRRHLSQGTEASLSLARGLGRQAVDLGLETLDLARMHDEALATLKPAAGRDGAIVRAKVFFSEAISPIEDTHHAALKASARLGRLGKVLDRRTAALAAINQSLKQGTAQRKAVERALHSRGGHSRKLLVESRRLHRHLQQLAHQLLVAQEDKRRRISRELQDEVAQTLLGINVRLLILKKEANLNAQGLESEVAATRRMVDKSMKSIERFARGFSRDSKPRPSRRPGEPGGNGSGKLVVAEK